MGDRRNTAIPLVGRWKMFDNLRRTLAAPTTFLALLVGWAIPLASAWIWTGFVLATIATPALLPLLAGIAPRRRGISKRSHLLAIVRDLKLALLQITLQVTLLAHQAWLMADAVVRTLFRVLLSRRNLLEWVTAAQSKISPRLAIGGFHRPISAAVALAAVPTTLVTSAPPRPGTSSAPF